MSWDSKIIWSEGMFLRTQHFQQQDRYVERLVRSRTAHLRPHPWGVAKLAIDRSLLTTGRFAIAEGVGTFPDGTPFAIPEDTDHPPPLELPENTRNAVVYLTLPVRQPGGREFGDRASEDMITRYEANEFEATDAVAGAENRAQLRVGKLRLRYALEHADRSGYHSIGLARIVEVRPDKNVLLDDGYIAPCLNCDCQPPLKGFLEELCGLLHTRGEALAARLVQPGDKGVADFADFVLLQAINRYEPLLAHFAADAGQLHPEDFYRRAIEIAGEIATFASRTKRATAVSAVSSRRPRAQLRAGHRRFAAAAERRSRPERRPHPVAAAALRHPRRRHPGSRPDRLRQLRSGGARRDARSKACSAPFRNTSRSGLSSRSPSS